MGAQAAGSPRAAPAPPPLAPGSDSNDTAAEWARRRGRQWVTRYVDVIGGFARKMDLTEMLLRVGLATLAVYAVYLALCESCKSEYLELVTSLGSALVDFATLTQGEASAAVAVSLLVWLLTVWFMRTSSPVYLIDFKTYRHKGAGGPDENTAGCPVLYERFFEESRAARQKPETRTRARTRTRAHNPKPEARSPSPTLSRTVSFTEAAARSPKPEPDPSQARHPDGSKCFTERSLEFQEKITRTSCISEDSIFPETIFASEKAGYWGKDAEKKALNMQGARDEAEAMMCKAVADLLKASGVPEP